MKATFIYPGVTQGIEAIRWVVMITDNLFSLADV